MSDHLISPIATGEAGAIFEYRVAGIMLSRMLRGAHIPVGIDLPLKQVAFQQHNSGYLFDDIVGYAESAENGPYIQIQVKRSISVTGRNSKFIEIMATALEVCRTQAGDLQSGRLRMGLAAQAPPTELAELSELTVQARSNGTPEDLQNLLRAGVTGEPLRKRYGHVKAAVAAAAGTDDEWTAAGLTHQVLKSLHVWLVLPDPDGRDWRAELDALAPIAAQNQRFASDVMNHLYDLAQVYGPRSGVVRPEQLRAELSSRHGMRFPPEPPPVPQASKFNITVQSGNAYTAETMTFYERPPGS